GGEVHAGVRDRLREVAQLAGSVLARDVDDHGLALALDRDPRALERGPSGAGVLDEQVDVAVAATPETRDALDIHPGRSERLRGLREPTRLVGQGDRQIGRHPDPPFDAWERSYPGGDRRVKPIASRACVWRGDGCRQTPSTHACA